MADEKDKNKDEEKLTPEEKLFRAIVREQKEEEDDEFFSDEKGGGVGTETDTGEEIDGGLFEWWRDFIKTAAERLPALFGSGKGSDAGTKKNVTIPGPGSVKQPGWLIQFANIIQIRAVNKIMVALVIALLIYFFVDLIFGVFRPVSSIAQSGAVGTSREIGLMPRFPDGGIRPLSHYLTSKDRKNAFFEPVPVASEAPKKVEAAPEAVVEPPREYRLVGISWDDEEFVAMLVEAEGGGHAVFARAGDELNGGVQVKDVTETAVTLAQGGQQWDVK